MALSYVEGYFPTSGWQAMYTASGHYSNRLYARFYYKISPNSDNTSYNVAVQTQFKAETSFQWYTGASSLKVLVTWTGLNGSQQRYEKTIDVNTPVVGKGESAWSNAVTFSGISAKGVKSINMSVNLSYTRTKCSICKVDHTGPGIGIWTRDPSDWRYWGYTDPAINPNTNQPYTHDHYKSFDCSGTVNVSSIPLLYPPQISNLKNVSPYNNQQGVSSRTDYIGLSWSHSGGGNIEWAEWSNNGGKSWNRTSGITSMSWDKLGAGSSWNLSIRAANSAGYSNVLSISIRTRHAIPNNSLQLISTDLETLTFKWSSDKQLAETKYKIDSGGWINLGQTGTEGTFTVKWFDPNSKHTITFWGKSTSTYDSLEGTTPSASGTTKDRSHITSIGDTIFGLSISVKITQSADKKHKLKIWTDGNSRTPTFEFDNLEDGIYTFSPTQDQLDDMYRCYSNTNIIPIYFLLTTHGDNKDWDDSRQSKDLTLTGIAKTAHIGVSNKPRRAQAWVGNSLQVPARAVCWVGDENNKPRRCI